MAFTHTIYQSPMLDCFNRVKTELFKWSFTFTKCGCSSLDLTQHIYHLTYTHPYCIYCTPTTYSSHAGHICKSYASQSCWPPHTHTCTCNIIINQCCMCSWLARSPTCCSGMLNSEQWCHWIWVHSPRLSWNLTVQCRRPITSCHLVMEWHS